MAEFTPTTEQVRRQVQDGVLSTGAIDGPAFDRWLSSIESLAERRGAVKALRYFATWRLPTSYGDHAAAMRLAAEFESGERDLP